MKRSLKVGLILIAVGLVLACGAGFYIKQRKQKLTTQVTALLKKTPLKSLIRLNDMKGLKDFDDQDDENYEALLLFHDNKDKHKMLFYKDYISSEIDNLEIRVSYSIIEIVESSSGRFELDVRGFENLRYEVELKTNATLSINIPRPSKQDRKKSTSQIILKVPKEKNLNEVIVDASVSDFDIVGVNCNKLLVEGGIGESYLSNIICESLDVTCSVGSLTLENSTCNNQSIIEGGVGEITMENCNLQNAKINGGVGEIKMRKSNFTNASIDCGIGQISFTGTLEGDGNITVGLGNVDITIEGNRNDYSIVTNKGLGSISIDNRSLDTENNLTAKNKLKIDGGLGSISVRFKN